MFHLRFGLSDHLKALLDFVFGSRRRVKKVRIFRAWFSQYTQIACVSESHASNPASPAGLPTGVGATMDGRTHRR